MLLDDVRTALRITHNGLDNDIKQHIEACYADMSRVGIVMPPDKDNPPPLYLAAVKLYVLAQYDYLGKGTEYLKNYEKTRNDMSLCSEYIKVVAE